MKADVQPRHWGSPRGGGTGREGPVRAGRGEYARISAVVAAAPSTAARKLAEASWAPDAAASVVGGTGLLGSAGLRWCR